MTDYLNQARERDSSDPLGPYRKLFYLPANHIYMDGNSLGLLSEPAEKGALQLLHDWKTLGIKGWLKGQPPWFYLAEQVGALAAKLVGAQPNEVIAMGGTTTNLHSLLAGFYHPRGTRTKILADELNFPSDIYALKGFLTLKGYQPETHLQLVGSTDGHTLNEDDIIAQMTNEVAIAWLPAVLFQSGQLLDIERLTREAHKRDILIGFDASHSAGAVPHQFHAHGVDFAVWCGYKYLNGGPGSSAFLYVHERHFQQPSLLSGWFGNKKATQFNMSLQFDQQPTAAGWQNATPPIFSLSVLKASLQLLHKAGIETLRKKSVQLTDRLIQGFDEWLADYGFQLATPREEARRGGHIALQHPAEVWRINQALLAKGVVPDFRYPDIIRLAPMALYNTYEDVEQTLHLLHQIMSEESYRQFSGEVAPVS